MSGPSNIAWTNVTWNPVRGCARVSEGCRKCYAEVMAARHSYPGGWGEGLATWVNRPDGSREARWTGVLRTVESALDYPVKRRQPSRIFVNSMSDLFHEDVPDEFITRVWKSMADSQRHVFQILTKRPQRMRDYLLPRLSIGDFIAKPLPNVWLGVSVEDQATADERIPLLMQTPAAVRWISAEPLLGPINLRQTDVDWLDGWYTDRDHLTGDPVQVQMASIDWVVIGGESGSDRRELNLDHARALGHQCVATDTPVFIKQDSGPRPGMQGRFTPEEWALKDYPA